MKNREGLTFFKSKWVEKLSVTPFWMPIVFWVPILVWILSKVYQQIILVQFALYFGCGLLFWSLAEYLLHRFIFHFKAKSKFGKSIVFIIHENHHVVPNDPLRGLFPVAPAALIGFCIYKLFGLFFGPIESLSLIAGFIVGYLSYDYLHFSFHHFQFKFSWWKKLKATHLYHHVHEESDFGVSNPLWDIILSSKGER